MSAADSIHMLARQLLLAVTLALASQIAFAHGGHGQQSRPVAAQAIVIADPAREAASEAIPADSAAWSKSCPGGTGGKCCCGGSPACAGAGASLAAISGGWCQPAPPRGAAVPAWPVDRHPDARSGYEPAQPRAPPFHS